MALNSQPSTLNRLLASSPGVGGAGGGLGFYFRGEFLDARHIAKGSGKIRAAVAGSHCGIEKAAADVCGTDGASAAGGRRPAENLHAETAQRARGVFDDVKYVGDDVRSLKLKAGEKLETRHLVSYQ